MLKFYEFSGPLFSADTGLDGGQSPELNPPATDGQGNEPNPAPATDGQGYFYSWTDPDKKEVKNFKDQDELSNYLANHHKSYNELRSTFTKKTQEYSERNRSYENDRAELIRRQQEVESRSKEISELDGFLKSNPHIYRKIKEEMNRGPSGSDLNEIIKTTISDQYGKDLDELKAYKAQVEAEKQREAAFSALSKKYGNIDKDKVLSRFEELTKSGGIDSLYELIHLSMNAQGAQQGSQAPSPEEIKSSAGILPAGNGQPGNGKTKTPKSFDEWREKMLNTI